LLLTEYRAEDVGVYCAAIHWKLLGLFGMQVSSSSLREHLPPLFFLKASFIVALAAVPVTNNLPMQGCEHFCQQVKREAGGCQKMKAGVR